MSNARLAIVLLVALGAHAAAGATHEEQLPLASTQPVRTQPATPPQSAQRPIGASQAAAAIASLPEPDRSFLRQTASANLAAIRLGELAASLGSSVEVRSLGREMVDTHTALSDQLRTSARTEGITLPMARLTPKQQRMYKQLSALSGPAFDDAFERNVMKLQREAIASFQNEAMHGKLSELAMLANQTLPLLNQRVRTVQNQLHRM
jgi:putative membrane protein